jgi:transcriptional regulator EpsA
MGSPLTLDQVYMHPLHQVVERSFSIARHIDYFLWMQETVTQYLPHDVLIAAWGDFKQGQLNYDVASNVPGVRTQALGEKDIVVDTLMMQLFDKWVKNDKKWFLIKGFEAARLCGTTDTSLLQKLSMMKTVLVYGMTDVRGKVDSLYVFFNSDDDIEIPHSMMGMLMPHVDAALRRVEWLATGHGNADELDESLPNLTSREQEILDWIKIGKTNYEIGLLMSISANTVKNHLKRVFAKMEVSCRAQAVAKYGRVN